jgi:hypothetical protein
MPDYQLDARRGCKITEDGGASKVYVEEGAQQVIAAVAAVAIAAADCGAIYTNAGAGGAASTRALTLPAPSNGLVYRFFDENNSGIRIVAQGGAVIRMFPGADGVSKANGYVESQFQGQYLVLRCVNSVWVCEHANSFDWTIEIS